MHLVSCHTKARLAKVGLDKVLVIHFVHNNYFNQYVLIVISKRYAGSPVLLKDLESGASVSETRSTIRRLDSSSSINCTKSGYVARVENLSVSESYFCCAAPIAAREEPSLILLPGSLMTTL